jgi:predicted Zn-dependent peptidase
MNTHHIAIQGERAMKISSTAARIAFQVTLAFALLAISSAPAAHAQGKSTDVSKVVRMGRAPVSKEILRVKLPTPTVTKLPNGLTVILLEDHKLPTVSFTMWIRPGQLADPADIPGLASFTADMLNEGTARRTSEQIANEVDTLGASLSASSRFGASYTSVNASGLINDAPQILDLMSDIVLHPAFSADELAKYKERQGADLEERLSNPGFLAQQAFRRVLYSEGALSIASATKESIAKVTQADLKNFHDKFYVPGAAILGVNGDFKAPEMKALIEKQFGGWSGGSMPMIPAPAPPASEAAKITLVDRPASVQTYIIGGDRSVRRADPDYYALAVMNQVVGGGPQARLFLDLREEHSLTYGSYSRLSAEVYPGDWSASAPVRTPVTGDAMERFTYEFKLINDKPVPASELDDAKRAIVAGFALSLEQPTQLLGYFLTAQHFDLPAGYWDAYPDRIAAIDAAAVQAAAKKYVDLAHFQWVCVGDRTKIQDALAKYGPVSVVDVTGKPEN